MDAGHGHGLDLALKAREGGMWAIAEQRLDQSAEAFDRFEFRGGADFLVSDYLFSAVRIWRSCDTG